MAAQRRDVRDLPGVRRHRRDPGDERLHPADGSSPAHRLPRPGTRAPPSHPAGPCQPPVLCVARTSSTRLTEDVRPTDSKRSLIANSTSTTLRCRRRSRRQADRPGHRRAQRGTSGAADGCRAAQPAAHAMPHLRSPGQQRSGAPGDPARPAPCFVGGLDDAGLLQARLRRPGRRLRTHGEPAGVRVVPDGGDVPGQGGSDGRSPVTQRATDGRELPGRTVTNAPIAAPRPIGSRPSRRAVRTMRGFDFAVRPPPFSRAASIAARSATRARSTPDTSPLPLRAVPPVVTPSCNCRSVAVRRSASKAYGIAASAPASAATAWLWARRSDRRSPPPGSARCGSRPPPGGGRPDGPGAPTPDRPGPGRLADFPRAGLLCLRRRGTSSAVPRAALAGSGLEAGVRRPTATAVPHVLPAPARRCTTERRSPVSRRCRGAARGRRRPPGHRTRSSLDDCH